MTRALCEGPPPPTVHHPEQIRRGGSGLPRRILVAADLTAEDQDAVAVAATLAAATGAELLHALRVEHPDLVVVPGAGEDPMRRLLSDHHIRRVLHHAAVPVLVVPVQP